MNSTQNNRDEHIFDRGAWFVFAIAIGWIIFIASITLVSLQFPSDGWRAKRDGNTGMYQIDSRLLDTSTPLQVDDVVTAINGQPISLYDLPPLPASLQNGQTLEYTIRRGNQTLTVDVTLRQIGAAGLAYNIISRWQETPRDFIVATLSFLVACFAFLLRPQNMGARYLLLIFSFYFAVQWFGFAVSELFYFTWHPWLSFLQSFLPTSWFWYFFPSLALMPLAFPVIKYPLRRFPHLLPMLFYGVPLTAAALSSLLILITHNYSWSDISLPIGIVTLALAVISLFGTLVHNWLTVNEPIARAQLRWVTLGLGGGLGLPFSIALSVLINGGRIDSKIDFILWFMLLLPVCLAIAITRYRLFDIDLIIRRTLIYSIITALLALFYFGSVVVLQQLFRAITGAGDDLAIIVSTLAIAALFNPLRHRVQDLIDHRFYRRKYDAQQVLTRFAQTARDEVELEKLTGELLNTVSETMQPTSTSLWLKTIKESTLSKNNNATRQV